MLKWVLLLLVLTNTLTASSPDFFVLGAQKGGTTSLYCYLQEHPQIQMPARKELHFYDLYYERGLQWYLSLFPEKNSNGYPLTGDVTPRYLPHPEVPRRMYSHFPDAKLIILLRNPVARAFSGYKHTVRFGLTDLPFEYLIDREIEGICSGDSHAAPYSGTVVRGLYARQIKRWLEYYPKEQILILISEDFFKNTQKNMDKIYAFLGLSPFKHAYFPIKLESSVNIPFQPETKRRLEEFYKPYNKELQQLLNQLGTGIILTWN